MRPHRSVNERLLYLESALRENKNLIDKILEKLEPSLLDVS